MTFEHLYSTYVDPLLPIGAVIIAYYLGRSIYFRQKEYELITERYLRNGLDRVTDQIERSLGQFRHNWARSLTVLKLFRDVGKDMNRKLYSEGFLEPDQSLHEIWTDYRVSTLLDDDIVNVARQSLSAFLGTSHAFFTGDLCTAVRLAVEGGKELKVLAERDKIVELYFNEANKLDQEAKRYYVLLGGLQRISAVLQTQRFSFKKLEDFGKLKSVRENVEAIRKEFDNDGVSLSQA